MYKYFRKTSLLILSLVALGPWSTSIMAADMLGWLVAGEIVSHLLHSPTCSESHYLYKPNGILIGNCGDETVWVRNYGYKQSVGNSEIRHGRTEGQTFQLFPGERIALSISWYINNKHNNCHFDQACDLEFWSQPRGGRKLLHLILKGTRGDFSHRVVHGLGAHAVAYQFKGISQNIVCVHDDRTMPYDLTSTQFYAAEERGRGEFLLGLAMKFNG